MGNDKSWNVSSRVDTRSHVRHCTDDSNLPSNTSLMIERCGGFDDDEPPLCFDDCCFCCCCCCWAVDSELMLDTELERLLLYADLLVLWLDVGLGEREYVDDTDCV